MWDAERDGLLQKMEQYQHDLSQLQDTATTRLPLQQQLSHEKNQRQEFSEPDSGTVPKLFMAGERVRILGLRQQQELNGQEGTVLVVHPQDQRIQVRVGQGRIVSLKAEKLELSASAAPLPPSQVRCHILCTSFLCTRSKCYALARHAEWLSVWVGRQSLPKAYTAISVPLWNPSPLQIKTLAPDSLLLANWREACQKLNHQRENFAQAFRITLTLRQM